MLVGSDFELPGRRRLWRREQAWRGTFPKSERGGIVVLDFGGQYTQFIARRIREQQVFSSILPCTASIAEIRALEPVGIVLCGGPNSVYDAEAPKCDPDVLQLGVPVLGICYGLQWITHTLGGEVDRAGTTRIRPHAAGCLRILRACWLVCLRTSLYGITMGIMCWTLPPGFRGYRADGQCHFRGRKYRAADLCGAISS